ncbi:hypothetical protein Tco_0408039 [Tanacetum coccineum]
MVSFYSSDIVSCAMVSLRSQTLVLTLFISSPIVRIIVVIVLTLWSLLLGPGAVPTDTTLSNRMKVQVRSFGREGRRDRNLGGVGDVYGQERVIARFHGVEGSRKLRDVELYKGKEKEGVGVGRRSLLGKELGGVAGSLGRFRGRGWMFRIIWMLGGSRIGVRSGIFRSFREVGGEVKPSRVQAKEHVDSLVNQLNQKSVEITDLNAQPGKGMYKLDRVTLAPRDKNNMETHIYYLKHTMEQAAILREIVEQAKSLNPLDSASYSACKYVKLIQEFLGYVRDTCPDIHKPSEKLVAVTPINKKKTVSYMFDARHELCFLNFVSDMNASSKSKSVKKAKKKEEWKPTGKVFTKIGYNRRPTGRTFTLVGNACPLTRITATNKVPLREPIPLEVVAQESVVTKVYTRRPKVPKTNGSNSKPKIAKSMISNKTEPGTSRGSNTSVAPSSSSVDLSLSKLFCGIWTPNALST